MWRDQKAWLRHDIVVLRSQGGMQKEWLRRDIVGSLYLLIETFFHAHTLQFLQRCLLCVKMKVTCRSGFRTRMFFLHWYLHFCFCSWLPASVSLKSTFFICLPGLFQVTWFFPTLWSRWHGCPNCFATSNPKHTTLTLKQCHLQVCP